MNLCICGCFPTLVWTEPHGGLGTVPARHWDTTVMKLECPTVFRELMPRKRGQTSRRKPSESQEWSEAKEERKGAVEIWKVWSSSPTGLRRRLLEEVPGKQRTQEQGSGKGRERKACLGKVQMSV